MKITKGMKLTPEQKAQRAESRKRNLEKRLKRAESSERERMETCSPNVLEKVQHLNEELDLLKGYIPTFTPAELRALSWFATKYGQRDVPPMHLARWIVQHMLANPGLVCAAIDSFHRFRNAEGFQGRGDELADARIAQRPEYR